MPAERFDVIFSGQLIEGQDPEQVRLKVGRMFKANEVQIKRLFSGKPVSIKQGVDIDTAGKYRLAFRKAGALVEIRSSRKVPDTAKANATKQGKDTPDPKSGVAKLSLAPAGSGSLEAYAPKIEAAPLPDIDNLSLAKAGSHHESAPDTTPAAIEIGDLDLVNGQDWTLEDCRPPPLPVLEPDISALDLTALDDTSHIPPEQPPQPLPDISSLSLEPQPDPEDIERQESNP